MLWIIKQGRKEVLVTTQVGEKSPDLTLPSDTWKNKVSPEEARREGPVALFFYPGDQLSVGAEEMSQVQQEIGRFKQKRQGFWE